MKKFIRLMVLCAVLLAVISPFASAAIKLPMECDLAGYGPQWMTICLVKIAMELWMDPLDLLHNR